MAGITMLLTITAIFVNLTAITQASTLPDSEGPYWDQKDSPWKQPYPGAYVPDPYPQKRPLTTEWFRNGAYAFACQKDDLLSGQACFIDGFPGRCQVMPIP